MCVLPPCFCPLHTELCDLWILVRFTQLGPLKCNIITYWCQNVSEKRQVCVCLTAQVTESFLMERILSDSSGCDSRGALRNLFCNVHCDIVVIISGCWGSSHWLDPLSTCLMHQGFFRHVQNHQQDIMKPVCWCFSSVNLNARVNLAVLSLSEKCLVKYWKLTR